MPKADRAQFAIDSGRPNFVIANFGALWLKAFLPRSFGTTKFQSPPVFSHRNLIGLCLLLLLASIVFGVVNKREVISLRAALANAASSQKVASRLGLEAGNKLKTREKELSSLKSKIAIAEARAHTAETELGKSQGENAGLKSKLQANATQLASLQKRGAEEAAAETPNATENISTKLKAELDETKRHETELEQEKRSLEEKLKAAQDHLNTTEDEKGRHRARTKIAGIHGAVLATNQAYNFVVLSIGERQGVTPNAEMLVMRSGTLIGRIRISSVEPTTSIGDIITNCLARGVQVQPGDTVIYAGNASF